MKNKQFSFWKDMMSGANGGISSKRVLGSFILIVLLVVIVINTFWGADNHWLGEAFITMIVGAFSLLGIGIFEKKLDGSEGYDHKKMEHKNQEEEINEEDMDT